MNAAKRSNLFRARPVPRDQNGGHDGSDLRTVAVKRAFASGVGAKAITVIAGLAAVAFGVRQLGDEPYGIVVALTGAVGIFGFLDFGIGNALIGLIARSHARKDHVELRSLLASSLVFLTIVGSLALVIGVAVVWLLPSTFVLSAQGVEDQSVRIAMTVLVCGVAFAIPSSLGSKLALGLQIGYQNNLVNVLSGLTILGLAFLGTVLNGGLVYFTAVFAVVPTIANAIQTLVLLTSRKHDHRPDFGKLRAAEIFRLLPAGIPFTVMTLAGALSYQVDTLLVAYLVSASAAAGYGFLIRIFNGASVFFIAGLQQVWASTSHALEEGNLAWVRHTFIRVFGATMALYAAGAILLLVFGQTIISVWSGGEVHVGQDLILAFALWSTYSFAMTQLSFLLNGAGIIKIQAISATCMAIVNVPLSVYLTIQWGSVGPLYGSLISHVLCVGVPTTIVATRLLSGIYETAAARSPRPDLDR